MKTSQSKPKDIDDYIEGFPDHIKDVLESIRKTIRRAAPNAQEAIKYGMPTFIQNGNLIHFAAFKKHIGLYPVPREVAAFRKELSAYDGEKSTARFPFDRPIPLDLIARIVTFRIEESENDTGKKQPVRNGSR